MPFEYSNHPAPASQGAVKPPGGPQGTPGKDLSRFPRDTARLSTPEPFARRTDERTVPGPRVVSVSPAIRGRACKSRKDSPSPPLENPPSLDTIETTGTFGIECVVSDTYERRPRAANRRRANFQVGRVFRGSRNLNLIRRAAGLENCGTVFWIRVPDDDSSRSFPVPVLCRDRFCPNCSGVRSGKIGERIKPLMVEVRAEGRLPKFMTLTQAGRPGENLRAAIRRMNGSFIKLRKTREWKSKVRGWVAVREFTYNPAGWWHAHIHLVADADYWLQADLSAVWEKVTGDSRIVDIREARTGWERELLKYMTKTCDLPPEKIVEMALALRNVRGVSTGGTWYGKITDEDLEREPGEEDSYEMWTFPELRSRLAQGDPIAREVLRGLWKWVGERRRPRRGGESGEG